MTANKRVQGTGKNQNKSRITMSIKKERKKSEGDINKKTGWRT